MRKHQHAVLEAYQQLKVQFKDQVVGLVEIGSYARDEAISSSDRDLRICIQDGEPYQLLRERTWTPLPDVTATYIEWDSLLLTEHVSFGLTNIAFIQRSIQSGQFPLNDHTCLFQGQIIIDEDDQLQRFYDRYYGVRFDNITPDYRRQLNWRVTYRLANEGRPEKILTSLDHDKSAIPVVHTCCRILRDIANIDAYHQSGVYLPGFDAVATYFEQTWPSFVPTVQTLFHLKRNEIQRHAVAKALIAGDQDWLNRLMTLQSETIKLWQHFEEDFQL